MRSRLPRFAFWAVVLLLAVGVLASIPARAAPVFTLRGYADLASGMPVPDGVTVDLVSAATHQTYTTTVAGGQFVFNGANTAGTLAPGWWGVWVPPQGPVNLTGCAPCGFLPATPNPVYDYQSATNLTTMVFPVTVGGVSLVRYTTTVSGTVNYGSGTGSSGPAAGAAVDVIDPTLEGFVLASATTNSSGGFSVLAPSGLFDIRTSAGGFYNYSQIVIGGSKVTLNPLVQGFLSYGNIFNAAAPGSRTTTGGNVTVIDTATTALDSRPLVPGFYAAGTDPGLGGGGRSFDVVVSPIDYGTVWYPFTSSGTTPVRHNVVVPRTGPPANFTTTITFSPSSFNTATVVTSAALANGSTFPDLPNASVGNLWEQFALDFQHSLGFSTNNFGPLVVPWLRSQGPFFPAAESGFAVNGTRYGPPDAPTSYTFSFTAPPPSTTLDFSSPNSLPLGWSQKYNTTKPVVAGGTQYTFTFNFRHPTHEQAFNYTVVLPSGFTLLAGTKAPANSRLAPAGPGSTWTAFTLVSQPAPSGSAFSTATFTAIKYTTLTANVAVTSSNFTYSSQNVINSGHNTYTVVAGAGQPLTFSGLPSTFPAGTNGSFYSFAWGDATPGGTSNVAPGFVNHTYARPGIYHGALTVTSSGGIRASTTFTVVIGSLGPSPKITTNATASETKTAGGVTYLLLNWSRTLQINITGSRCPISAAYPSADICGSANYTLTSAGFSQSAGFAASSNVPVNSNWTPTLLGAGTYLTSATIGGTSVPFLGWEYTLGLTLWSADGVSAGSSLIVLVRDTEKPMSAITLTDIHGKPITGAGLMEGANFTAPVVLSSTNSSDPHNGSIVSYSWTITNPANSSLALRHNPIKQTAPPPTYTNPGSVTLWLAPQSRPYTVNLTTTDRAGNVGSTTATVSISANTSTRPVPSPTNLTVPKSMNAGTSYTVDVNVTNTVGKLSTALDLTVRFYLCPPGSACTPSQRSNIGDASSVRFYTVNASGAVGTTPIATGVLPSLAYNHTVRAVLSFTPSQIGTFDLYANATSKNAFYGELTSGANLMHVRVTINQNPVILDLEYAGIGIAAVVVILILIGFYYRRQGRGFLFIPAPRAAAPATGRAGLERGGRRRALEEEEDEDEL